MQDTHKFCLWCWGGVTCGKPLRVWLVLLDSRFRDGAMRVDNNAGARIGYEPNTQDEWNEQPDFAEPPLSIEGAADHWNHREDDDYYSQPRALFQLMTTAQQQVLFENTARSVGGARLDIQHRHIRNCYAADPAYGIGVANALGLNAEEIVAAK